MKKTLVLTLCFICCFINSQNLILNPGFEIGTPAWNTTIVPASWPSMVGFWEFNNTAAPLTATVGSNLTLVGSHSTISGYTGGDNGISIGVGSHYNVVNPIGANSGSGGASYTNMYSILFDFKITSIGAWKTFYQTSTTNANDGDLFIRNSDGLIGVGTYSVEGAIANVWHRMILSRVHSGGNSYTMNIYLDGRIVLSLAQTKDDRWSIESMFKLFADDNGDDGTIDISTVALFNKGLTQAEVESLGRWTCNNWIGMGNYQQQLRNGGYPGPFAGTYYCYAGSDASLVAEQIVDLSAYSMPIDAGFGTFTFSGRMQTYTQNPQDNARILVEYRNGAGVVLSTYNSGNVTTSGAWLLYSDTRTVPVGTRDARIRLFSTKNNGVSNDAYYDDMSLTTPIILSKNSIEAQIACKKDQHELTLTTYDYPDEHYVIQLSEDGINWKEGSSLNHDEFKLLSNQYVAVRILDYLKKGYVRLVDGQTNQVVKASIIEDCENQKQQLLLYPNPNKGEEIHISGIEFETAEVEITDALGKQIRKQIITKNNSMLSNDLTPGYYFVNIKCDSAIYFCRLIVCD